MTTPRPPTNRQLPRSGLPETQGRVAVVIVNFNGRHLLDDCIQSLTHAGDRCEVILVDNASSDGSAHHVRQRYPAVTVIESGANLGFGRACNLGVSHTRAAHILLLNSDARLKASLNPALEYMQRDPDVAVIGGLLRYPDGRLQPSIGLEHTPARVVASWTGLGAIPWVPTIFRRECRDLNRYGTAQPSVAWVSGALMLIRRSAWEAVGGMHPAYFMYVEDVDFCRAVRDLGGRVAYLPSLEALHLEGGGRGWVGRFALLNTVDSYQVYFYRHFGAAAALGVRAGLLPAFALRAGANALLAAMTGDPQRWDKAKAFAAGISRLMSTQARIPPQNRG